MHDLVPHIVPSTLKFNKTSRFVLHAKELHTMMLITFSEANNFDLNLHLRHDVEPLRRIEVKATTYTKLPVRQGAV